MRIPVLQLCICFVYILKFLTILFDIFHDLSGGYHVCQLVKLKIHVDNTLGTLCFYQRHQHIKEIILFV